MSAALMNKIETRTEHYTQGLIAANTPDVLTNIYQKDISIVTWKRELSSELTSAVNDFLNLNKTKAAVLAVTPENTNEVLCNTFGDAETMMPLRNDIALLVDMFCCLFELKGAGLRITILDRAMCPRFHFDRIPCRLVTTYQGAGTQWLQNDCLLYTSPSPRD